MNLPNKLTMLRVLIIPVFVFFMLAGFIPYNAYIALGLFVVASLTDMLDGKIARKRNLVTNFGKFMDPLADKLLVVSALLCLLVVDGGTRICASQTLSLIAIIVIVAREFIISGFRLVASDAGIVIAASMWGKFKTATTMVSICIMLVVKELAEFVPFISEVSLVIFWIAVTLTIVSLVDYLVKNMHVIRDLNSGKKKDDELAGFTMPDGIPGNDNK
ncbi:MAG: CDP-diacylglycerol--glycerol-3-phosphate 3-phosphatidyltransferase [Lachnospiraceae bacterium]|nr:CDP-diacylglycerol--glycerol-3-phosphate 3-phosphatidyltransferase [Lachnospiraceae bacterium]